MIKKNWLMTSVLIALAGVYILFFTDRFKPKIISITSTSRALGRRPVNYAGGGPAVTTISFGLEPPCKPTEIKVVPLAAWMTNQSILPVWHLIYSSNSAPVKMFFYGQRLRGLQPEVPGSHAEPLQPDVTYRLFLTAGKAKGQHDFEIKSPN